MQSGLLAQKDSWTPCIGVVVQLVLNCILDVLLIGYCSGGLAGAAWATVFAQWAGCLVTLWCLPRGGRVSPLPHPDFDLLGMHTAGLYLSMRLHKSEERLEARMPTPRTSIEEPTDGLQYTESLNHSSLYPSCRMSEEVDSRTVLKGCCLQVQPSLKASRDDMNRLSDTFGPATLILLCKNVVYVAVTVRCFCPF